jgi:hypothetical protein
MVTSGGAVGTALASVDAVVVLGAALVEVLLPDADVDAGTASGGSGRPESGMTGFFLAGMTTSGVKWDCVDGTIFFGLFISILDG